MLAYLIRRLFEGVILLVLVSMVLFAITYSLGDPLSTLTDGSRPPTGQEALRLRRQLGLDQPLPVQYLYWLIGNDWARTLTPMVMVTPMRTFVAHDADYCVAILDAH